MRRYWTIKEIQILKDFYYCVPNDKIAKYLKRTESAIKQQARKQGLVKEVNSGNFKKGMTPWNKGISVDIGGKETRFKKGSPPPTANPNKVSIQVIEGKPYKMIWDETKRRKREFLHRKLWIDKNGPIPEGCVLRCKSTTLNPDPDNWECITRAENLRLCRKDVNWSRVMRLNWIKRKAKAR